MNPVQFGTGSPWETLLTYLFTILLFGMFFAAILVPIFWIGSNIKERWHDYDRKKRIRVVATSVLSIAFIALLIWRGSMPSNF
jgi:tetrahydromethanopterin S-methyltransferase subunit D